MIESHVGDLKYRMPMQFIIKLLELVVPHVQQGEISGGDHPARRMPLHIPESMYLLEKHIFQTGPFPKYPIGSGVKTFLRKQQITKQ
jgi:hypothetical protein